VTSLHITIFSAMARVSLALCRALLTVVNVRLLGMASTIIGLV